MKLPGFTAEASLSKSSERFKEGPKANGAGTQAVIPQFCVNVGPCVFHRRLRCCASLFSGVKCSLVSC